MHNELDKLLETIKKDRDQYFIHRKTGIFSYHNPTLQISLDDNFEIWWHSISKVLVSLPYPKNYHYRLVNDLKQHGFTESVLDEFRTRFPSEKRAVWWYTQAGTFYDILNRAFRQRNLKVLLLFGSFVQDLYLTLKEEQSKHGNSIDKVYRGQVFSGNDLEKLSPGCSIQNLAFFSTSTVLDEAKSFLFTSSELQDVTRVIFEIEIDYNDKTALFADIAQLSYFPSECEILFMINTRFTFQTREERNDIPFIPSYWAIKMKVQPYYDILRDRPLDAGSGRERKTLKNCLNALSDMSELIATVKDTVIFDVLMNIYPDEAKWIRAIKLSCLAEFEAQLCDDPTKNKDDYSSALSQYEEAMNIWLNYLDDDQLNCSFDIAQIYNAMAELYSCGPTHVSEHYLPSLNKAAHFYELALKKCSTTDYELLEIVHKLQNIYTNLSRTDPQTYGLKAITFQEHWMKINKHKTIPSKSKELASEYEDLADRYAMINRYEDALNYNKQALELYLSNNTDENVSLAVMNLYTTIITLYTEKMKDFNSALSYQLLRHDFCMKWIGRKTIPLSEYDLHCLADSHFFIADCYVNTREFDLALKYLIEGLILMRQRRDLIAKEGQLVFREGKLLYTPDGEPLRESCGPNHRYLNECISKIKEKEEKVKHIKRLLKRSSISSKVFCSITVVICLFLSYYSLKIFS